MTTRSKVLVMRETRSAYLFLLPSLIFFVGFVIIPMFMCLFTSFFNYTMSDFKFVGIGNYVEMFQDKIFQRVILEYSAYRCRSSSCGNYIFTVGRFIHL